MMEQADDGVSRRICAGRRTMSEAEYLAGMPLDYTGLDEAILDFEVLN